MIGAVGDKKSTQALISPTYRVSGLCKAHSLFCRRRHHLSGRRDHVEKTGNGSLVVPDLGEDFAKIGRPRSPGGLRRHQ